MNTFTLSKLSYNAFEELANGHRFSKGFLHHSYEMLQKLPDSCFEQDINCLVDIIEPTIEVDKCLKIVNISLVFKQKLIHLKVVMSAQSPSLSPA